MLAAFFGFLSGLALKVLAGVITALIVTMVMSALKPQSAPMLQPA